MSRPFGLLDKIRKSDPVDVEEWAGTITYAEVHEFTKGSGLALLAALSGSRTIWKLVAAYALAVTGIVHLDVVEKLDSVDKREDHYFLAGIIAGSLLATLLGIRLI